MDIGRDGSADSWISPMGEEGDLSQYAVIYSPMPKRVRASGAKAVLDVGCGEGRFCRIKAEFVPVITGLDPTEELLRRADGHLYAEKINKATYLQIMEWRKPLTADRAV